MDWFDFSRARSGAQRRRLCRTLGPSTFQLVEAQRMRVGGINRNGPAFLAQSRGGIATWLQLESTVIAAATKHGGTQRLIRAAVSLRTSKLSPQPYPICNSKSDIGKGFRSCAAPADDDELSNRSANVAHHVDKPAAPSRTMAYRAAKKLLANRSVQLIYLQVNPYLK
jgi:hypothetical protein